MGPIELLDYVGLDTTKFILDGMCVCVCVCVCPCVGTFCFKTSFPMLGPSKAVSTYNFTIIFTCRLA